jgi:molecular chaperone GrpE
MNDHETSPSTESLDIDSATEQKLKESLQEAAQWKDKAMRAAADVENMRRRSEKERHQWTLIAQKEIIMPLLAVVDDVERAMKQQKPDNLPEELKSWFAGFEMVHKAFEAFLKKIGIEKVNVNQEFDPAMHESIGSIHSDLPAGSIAQVVQEGYLLNGTVIRPAKVLVAA